MSTKASPKERASWEICGGGYGIHWPEIDEDLSIQGLLRGAPAPRKASIAKKPQKLGNTQLGRRLKSRTRTF